MDEKIVHEILQDLFSSLEALETQSRAISQFLKDKGIVNEKEFAPYLEQAGNASGIRWLAARVRIDYLLSGAMKESRLIKGRLGFVSRPAWAQDGPLQDETWRPQALRLARPATCGLRAGLAA